MSDADADAGAAAAAAAAWTPPRPHSSTAGHLAAETAVLATLYARSRAQHRAQVWLVRLAGVLRLARLVGAAVAGKAAPRGRRTSRSRTLALARRVRKVLLSTR